MTNVSSRLLRPCVNPRDYFSPIARIRRLAGLLILGMMFPVCLAGDISLGVQLVGGTDGLPPKDSKYEPLEPQVRTKLARIFKWKNYFLIHEQKVTLTSQDEEKRLKLSTKCEIELKRIDDSTLQVKLFGEGRWTKTVRQSIKA
ncbi:MAG: hypothetical protein N3G20_07765, partial [Verrucomicrobiae bacterium]|nr:hypothetical protein [Verrucomicrobiae bacterium]